MRTVGWEGNHRLPPVYTEYVLDLVWEHFGLRPNRAQRQYYGELIQIDGSEHHWFGDIERTPRPNEREVPRRNGG